MLPWCAKGGAYQVDGRSTDTLAGGLVTLQALSTAALAATTSNRFMKEESLFGCYSGD